MPTLVVPRGNVQLALALMRHHFLGLWGRLARRVRDRCGGRVLGLFGLCGPRTGVRVLSLAPSPVRYPRESRSLPWFDPGAAVPPFPPPLGNWYSSGSGLAWPAAFCTIWVDAYVCGGGVCSALFLAARSCSASLYVSHAVCSRGGLGVSALVIAGWSRVVGGLRAPPCDPGFYFGSLRRCGAAGGCAGGAFGGLACASRRRDWRHDSRRWASFAPLTPLCS